jgi:hypothetical protein
LRSTAHPNLLTAESGADPRSPPPPHLKRRTLQAQHARVQPSAEPIHLQVQRHLPRDAVSGQLTVEDELLAI